MYSIMGAAGVTGSITRAVSVAIIAIELNGHFSHLISTMICVIFSYGTSEILSRDSFFTMLSKFRGLDAKMELKKQIIVRDVLDQKVEYTEMEVLSLKDST